MPPCASNSSRSGGNPGRNRIPPCRRQRGLLETELKRLAAEVKRAVAGPEAAERLAGLQGQLAAAEARLGAVSAELAALDGLRIDEADMDRALRSFDPVWESLNPSERGRLLDLLLERVDYDGPAGHLAIRFRPTGIRTLAQPGGIQCT